MGRYLEIARRVPKEPRDEGTVPEPVAVPPGFGRPEDWPPECLASLRRYHRPPVLNCPHAILFPLLGRRVQTPRGPGKLLQVFSGLATVVLDSEPERAAVFEPAEIRPLEVRRYA